LKRLVLIGVAVVALLAATLVGLWQVSRARCFALGGDITCRVETQAPLVALTFDDGPTQLGVDAVLPVLERHGATATFFLVGAAVERRPDLARRIRAAGHELGNHSYTHQRMMLRPADWYDSEIARTEAALARAGGGGSGLFRPPYGKKLWGLPQATRRAGLAMVMMDIEEPKTTDPAQYAREVLAEAQPGSILLLHAMFRGNQTARDALPLILDGLKAKGLRPVSVGELMASAEPGNTQAPNR
jgi:peptidoglycan/xylan/chitin deacetylase (PgdA/CDA1 family)